MMAVPKKIDWRKSVTKAGSNNKHLPIKFKQLDRFQCILTPADFTEQTEITAQSLKTVKTRFRGLNCTPDLNLFDFSKTA